MRFIAVYLIVFGVLFNLGLKALIASYFIILYLNFYKNNEHQNSYCSHRLCPYDY